MPILTLLNVSTHPSVPSVSFIPQGQHLDHEVGGKDSAVTHCDLPSSSNPSFLSSYDGRTEQLRIVAGGVKILYRHAECGRVLYLRVVEYPPVQDSIPVSAVGVFLLHVHPYPYQSVVGCLLER